MSEPPAEALRKKKDSSMRVAINLVKPGAADACVSAGNTGALMATARFVLKMLPGIDRPAIITELPAIGGSFHMLDLGANTQATADHLFQYAVMGSIVAADVVGIEQPRVALLNIGAEDTKGHDTVKEAAAVLTASTLNYVGFVEGHEPDFKGKADVVVTDGFTGNVALKTMEGTVGLGKYFLKGQFKRNWLTKLQALLASAVCCAVSAAELDSRNYNGATLGRPEWYCNKKPRQRGCLRIPARDRYGNCRSTKSAATTNRQIAAEGSCMTYSRIVGTGRYLPERIMTNADLEKIVDTTDEWIRTRTGVERRHVVEEDQTTSDMCVEGRRRVRWTMPASHRPISTW